MKAVVVGGGRMGLPLACLLAENGAQVTVCDTNPAVVAAINRGAAPYEEPGLAERLIAGRDAARLDATSDTAAATAGADTVIIIVPAHLAPNRDIDYSILESASADVGKGLRKGTLVSFETTVAVGGTRGVLAPVLEKHSGLEAGADFKVAFSPERVKANRVFEKLQETPKIVGGYNDASAEAAAAFYRTYLGAPIINVKTLEAAEFAKLAGMVYRDVNIALANELAAYGETLGLDFAAVRRAANTNGEANLLLPGVGVGGHCTPLYPYFLVQDAVRKGVPQALATAARDINDRQPARNIERLQTYWGPIAGKRVHVMGLAFRPDVKVEVLSSAYSLKNALFAGEAIVTLEDPLYSDDELRARGFEPARVGRDPLDAVILNTAHTAFKGPDFALWRSTGLEVVLDGRDCWDRGVVEAAGLMYLGVGKGA